MEKEKVRELVEEAGWINTSIVIEIQGNDKEHVKKSLENLVARLEKEKGIKVHETKYDKIEELKEKWYSLNVEVKFIAKDFGRLVHVALLYSPSMVEIIEPEKGIKVPIGELQNTLIDISNVVTGLAHAIYAQQGKMRLMEKSQTPEKPKNK